MGVGQPAGGRKQGFPGLPQARQAAIPDGRSARLGLGCPEGAAGFLTTLPDEVIGQSFLPRIRIDSPRGFTKTVVVADTTVTGRENPSDTRWTVSPMASLSAAYAHAYNSHCGPGGAAFGLAGRRVPVSHPRRLARHPHVRMSCGPLPNTEPAMPNASACIPQALLLPPSVAHSPSPHIAIGWTEVWHA